ncbi:MAG: hypothetical protein K0U74_00090 [Alphaproteobacteria bacterium]|nr:hypothetical protein [Alphaproteobacteria bacterium]
MTKDFIPPAGKPPPDAAIKAAANDPGVAASRAPSDREIKKLLADYFSRKYDETVRQHLAAEATTSFTRWIIAAIGAALFAAPFIKVIITAETDRQLIGQQEGQLFLLPGFLLLLIAATTPIWRQGWMMPLALSIAVAALDLYVFKVGHVGIIYALLVLAAGVLLWDVRSFVGAKRKPKSVMEFEAQIDIWTERQLRNLITQARKDLPIDEGRLAGDDVVLLKSFPKADRLNKSDVLARIGTDNVPRMSPVGLAAFDFGPDDVLVFEGAVDLNTTKAVYMRVHQFAYRHIAAVSWSSDVWPPKVSAAIPQRAASGGDAARGGHGGTGPKADRASVLRRDELQIRLSSQHLVTLVFRDGSLSERLANRPFERIEKMDRIKEVWGKLTAGRKQSTV